MDISLIDLNLTPVDLSNSSDGSETVSGTNWSLWAPLLLPVQPRNFTLEGTGGEEQQSGEGSVDPKEKPMEPTKLCKNCNSNVEDNNDVRKNNVEESSFFDCNICFDLAKDPVVTCCGHLFCWPCLYKWLHHHSHDHECPLCKGEVNKLTPIYGRGNNLPEPNLELNLNIPLRPQAWQTETPHFFDNVEHTQRPQAWPAEASHFFDPTPIYWLGNNLPEPNVERTLNIQARPAETFHFIEEVQHFLMLLNSVDRARSSHVSALDSINGWESIVALSDSRRRDAARISDVESRDSRDSRRRRLN